MIRIIGETAYQGNAADYFKLRAVDLGNGHLEFVAHRPIVYTELDWSPAKVQRYLDNLEKWPEHTDDELRLRHRERSARRAKTNVRRLCKVLGAVSLMTLTYRANQTDLALCKRHLKEFVRRLRRLWPDFAGVAAFERQKRGAWHVHLAVPRVPAELSKGGVLVKSFPLLLSVWRSVVGLDNGAVNVKSRKRNSKRSPAKLASYLSKYIMKAFLDGDDHSNRWTKFGDFVVPRAVDLGIVGTALAAIEAAYTLGFDGVTSSAYIGRFADLIFFAFEALPSVGVG